MEHLGHLAFEARRASEADGLVGTMVPLAIWLLPGPRRPAMLAAVPRLVRSTTAIVHGLRADPAIRPLVRLVPRILTGALARHGDRASAGGRPDVVETVANEARRVLADPATCVDTYAQSRSADAWFHRAAAGGLR